MATDKLRSGVYHDVCSMLNRPYQVRCAKCIINDQWNLMTMCYLSNSFNINNVGVWVTQSFNIPVKTNSPGSTSPVM